MSQLEVNCAPSKNLNVAYPHFATAKEMYQHLREITKPVSVFIDRVLTDSWLR